MRSLFYILTFGAALLGCLPVSVSAQADQSAARSPVLIALVDTLPDTTPRFRVVRLAGESRREVVLLPADATPDLLTAALETLRVLWAGGGDDASVAVGGAMFRRAPATAETRPARVLPWADRVLRDLRDARPRHVPGVGHVRAVQIWLAPLPASAVKRQP